MNKQKGFLGIAVVLVVALLLVGGLYLANNNGGEEGIAYSDGTSSQDPTIFNFVKAKAGFGVGTTTSDRMLSSIIAGTCSLVSNSTILATTTGTGTCAATGAQVGDQVFISLATTTTKMAAQFIPVGTVAGSNTVTVRLINLTGVDAVPAATNGFGSSTQYWIVRSFAQ